MSATHRITIEDIDVQRAAGYDEIRLFTDPNPDGTFNLQVSASVPLVAGQQDYVVEEAVPVLGNWYRYALYDITLSALTTLSPAWQVNFITVADILLQATGLIGGFQSVCTADGGPATLIDDVLRDNSQDEDYLDGNWVLRPFAVEADHVRRSSKNPFTPGSGEVAFIRDWTTPPVAGERYGVFQRIPPIPAGTGYSWIEALADALEQLEYPDEINLGPGTNKGKSRFSFLGYTQIDADRVWQVLGRDIDENGEYHELDWDNEGRYWEKRSNGFGNTDLFLWPPPPPTMDVIACVWRRFDRVYRLDDQTDCPLRLAAYGTVVKVYEYLNIRDGGNRWGPELSAARARYNEEKPSVMTGGTAVLGV